MPKDTEPRGLELFQTPDRFQAQIGREEYSSGYISTACRRVLIPESFYRRTLIPHIFTMGQDQSKRSSFNQRFSNDFTDEVGTPSDWRKVMLTCKPQDAARLCQYASLAHPLQGYTCGWMTGQAVCGSLVQGSEFSEHLRSRHGVGVPGDVRVMCCWNGCFVKMKKEHLVRHVNETHLEIKHACPHCPAQFTRDYTLELHVSKKHSVS